MSHRQGQMAVILVVAVALAACASAPRRTDGLPAPPAPKTTVHVQNHLAEDMAIYVVNAVGGRWRLGTVTSASDGNLLIPDHLLSQWGVQLMVRPIGPGSARAFTCVRIAPGSNVHLLLERALPLSMCSMQ